MNKSNKSPKKVLMLVQNLPVPFDRRVWLEATSLQSAGYQVTVICPATRKYPKLREKIDDVLILRFPLMFEGRSMVGIAAEYVWSFSCMFIMSLFLSVREKIDIVHFCNPPDLLFLCAFPAKLLRKSKLIFDQHDLCPEIWELKSQKTNGIVIYLLKFFERISYNVADIVVSTNESYRKIALDRGKKDPKDVFIVRSAPKLDFIPQDIKVIRDCNLELNLAYLGTMGSQEGIDLLLDAISDLVTMCPKLIIRLDLVGDGPETESLIEYSKSRNLGEIAFFHGRVSDDMLKDIIGSADIAVNSDRPSTFNSLSSMNKIVEYMALGRPIIQFYSLEGENTARESIISVREPTAQALAKAIDLLRIDEFKRKQMSSEGLKRFRSMCWENQAKVLLEAYSQALDTRSKSE